MYINIGNDFAVRTDTVIGIFDLDNTTSSRWTRNLLAMAQENGEIVETTEELPKSFLVTNEYGLTRIYLTQYNAAILERRFAKAQQEAEKQRRSLL